MQFIEQRRAGGERLQTLAPLGEAGAHRCQGHALAGRQLAIGLLQIFHQDTPGHAVHHQVMNHDQQALAAIPQGQQGGPQQRAAAQIQAGLQALGLAQEHLGVRGIHFHQPVLGAVLAVALLPDAHGVLFVAQAQAGMLLGQGRQAGAQGFDLQRLQRAQ